MTLPWWFQLYACMNGLMVTLLALNVSRLRIRERVGNGDGDRPVMKRAIRAHGNGVEHVTVFGLCLLALELGTASTPLLATLVIGFTLCRALHAAAMLCSRFDFRRIAAGGTYLFELAAIGALALRL